MWMEKQIWILIILTMEILNSIRRYLIVIIGHGKTESQYEERDINTRREYIENLI
jgi:hypothetical protein